MIFVGPSLAPRLRPSDPIWEWRPPVRQGDVYRAALTRPDAIGVIDGYFETVPTVWHKEILWAMAEGIPVFGAASIGALRAAELDSFGMIGVGRIYKDFRDGVLEDDDEVAVLHGPAELGYPAVTEAMVNIRATLAAAVTAGIHSPEDAAALTATAKRLFYKERTWQTVLDTESTGCPGPPRRLAVWLPTGRVDQKQRDAEALLTAIRLCSSHKPTRPRGVTYRLAETVAWRAAQRNAAGG